MKQLSAFGHTVPMPGLSIPQVFLALAIANVVVAIWIFTIVPEFLMRFLSWVMVRALYRLRLHGIEENVPDEGAALLVCNHVSYMDALDPVGQRAAAGALRHVLQDLQHPGDELDLPHRQGDPDRRRARGSGADAARVRRDRRGAGRGRAGVHLPRGRADPGWRDRAVQVGRGTHPGAANESGRPVPVVPMALRGMWTSMWSRRDGRMGRMRVPRRFRAHVEVVAGEPIDGRGASAGQLEAQVRALRGSDA